MKNFEYIDTIYRDGEFVNLYMSLKDGECYTFTDEEVEMMEKAEANIEKRREQRELKKVIRARKARRNKRLAVLALVGILVLTINSTLKKDEDVVIEPSTVFESQDSTYNLKSKLVDLLNAANGEYDDVNYRKLFYLYYNVYYSGIEGPSLINSLIDYANPSSVLTVDDFEDWYETGNIDFRKLMAYPEQTANMIDYDNIDIFLNFNICLKKEIDEGNLTVDEYLAYITPFLTTLENKDSDIKRVWDYYADNNSTTKGYIDVKLLCYEDTLKKEK